jgi:hypothetical protein
MKQCRRCGEWLDSEMEFRRIRGRNGSRSTLCRACENRDEYRRILAEREEYQERMLEIAREARRRIGDCD